MTSDTTKLLKHVDADIWKRFRAYCVAHDLNMGPAISALMLGVLVGRVSLQDQDGVSASASRGSWHWPGDRKDGTP